ncbi:MAG: glycosyltransferase family 4 protein, partial [Bacillota bacterium]
GQLFDLDNIPVDNSNPVVKDNLFDSLASLMIGKADILHSWNGHCLFQMHRAHDLGMKCIVERASTHIEYQYKLLKEEHEKFGIKHEPINPLVMKKSLLEYDKADYIFVPSKFAYDTFPKKLRDKLRLIPFGVDIEKFKPKKLPHDEFTCLFIGDNLIRKGYYYLERAWSELNLKNAKLIIKTNVKMRTPSPNIEIVGFVKDVTELYNKTDVFVFPSVEEGSALVCSEAASMEVPVITTYNSGTWLTDKRSCFLIPIANVEAIKDKILYFYNNPEEIKKFGKRARKEAKQHTWHIYSKELIKTYESIGTEGKNG